MGLLACRRRAVVLVLTTVLLGGCGSGTELVGQAIAAPPEPTVTPAPAPPPAPAPVVVWPLTGLPATTPVDHPALAVKVENSPDARPQTGLAQADVVWEQVVEGGISRFVAVYQSQVPVEVGPVRSTRPMDPAITAPLHGLFATSGGQGPYLAAVADAGLQLFSFDAGDDGFYRSGDRDAPHNVYLDPAPLYASADTEHLAAPAAQFGYAPTAGTQTTVVQGSPTAGLDLTMSVEAAPSWAWSPTERVWQRAEDTEPAVDADGVQLAATNVVVLRVAVVGTSAVDPAGNPVPETLLTDRSGEGLVATAGRTVPVTWSKAGDGDAVVLTAPDGSPVLLAPGTTWVELVPEATGEVTTR